MSNKIDKIIVKMKNSQNNVSFTDLMYVCQFYFGNPTQKGTSHIRYKTNWKGDPRINIQNNNGKAKAYQVKMVLLAIKKIKDE